MAVLETRAALAPYVGRVVRCRGVAMRDGPFNRAQTFLTHLDVDLGGGWEHVASHVWLNGRRLCEEFGRAVVLEFDAAVRRYSSNSPLTGGTVVRYGVADPRAVVSRGPAALADLIREVVAVFGWEAVADAVAAAHGDDLSNNG